MPETEQQPAFQFGVFELNPRTRELRKHGVKLKLQDQPLLMLILLLERPGEIITREEIQKRLWPENTYVDFDNAINSAVRKLRDALGDEPANPRFIETLARRGYRFIAPVSRTVAADHRQAISTIAKEQIEAAVPKGHFRWAVPAVVAAVVLAGIGLVWVVRDRGHQAPAAPVPLTSYPGFQLFPSFSPEGTRVAFSWGEPGKRPSNIYVKMIGPGEPVRLTSNSSGDFAPAWSPDGRLIAFLRAVDHERSAIIVIPALGGQERELARIRFSADLEMSLPDWEWEVPPPFLAWSPDGKWLLALDQRRVVRISAESGEKRPLTSPPPAIFGDGSLAVSPDGKTLAFTRTVTYSVSDVYVVPISKDLLPTSEPQRITSDSKEITGLAWTSDGRALVFPSMRGGRLELWRTLAKPSSKPRKLTVTGDDPFDPAISRQAHRLVYAHKFGYENVWRVSLKAKQAGEATDLVPSTREEGHPRYSSDGKRIAFEASFSGREEIWVDDANGSNPIQLTSFKAWAGSPRWSPDGRKIAFDCNAAGNWDIYVIGSQGGKPVRLTANPAMDARASWSHDG
ncbi:MAG: winged helix-turn-helix domain-containing protein, partial [Bryobacteraceae bacterium]